MTNIFYTSDWHLWHKRIIEYCPFSRKGDNPVHMTELILENISTQCKPGDIIYNIGDVSFGTHEQTKNFLDTIKNKLRLQHHLILGNHDYAIKKSDELCSYFASVQDVKTVSIGKQSIVLSHFPMEIWDRAHHGAWHFHGHRHSEYQSLDGKKRLDVGIDTRQSGDMKMYTHDEVKKIMDWQNNSEHH